MDLCAKQTRQIPVSRADRQRVFDRVFAKPTWWSNVVALYENFRVQSELRVANINIYNVYSFYSQAAAASLISSGHHGWHLYLSSLKTAY